VYIFWAFLSFALLFNQVGLSFFHDSHEAHEFFKASEKSQTLLLNHGEHCQACSLEVLFNIVLPVSTEIPTQFFAAEFNEQDSQDFVFIFFGHAYGRAPPSVA
jgi:hypothetical protein